MERDRQVRVSFPLLQCFGFIERISFRLVPSENRAPNDKHPLLLPPHPLNNLVRALRQSRPRRIRRRNSIQLEKRRAPRKRYTGRICFMVHLERCGFVVQVGVEFVVKVE
jgi:hypothetical protein